MKSIKSFTDIYLSRRYVDFRKGINGLATLVQDEMDLDPFDGALFIFCSRTRDKIKILYWDRTGFALWHKRLEKDKFKWPKKLADEVIILDQTELEWLLDGFDITKMQPHETLQFRAVS